MAHIVVIDDDLEFAGNLATVLRDEHHEVDILEHTENAIKELSDHPPDLLILDVMFPDNPAAGFDLARKIRNTPAIKTLPIILLTGVNQQFPMDFSAHDIDLDWMPVQDFVEKPVTMSALLDKVKKLLKV